MRNNDTYQVGDIVKVLHPGQSYPTYRELFEYLGFRNKRSNDPDDWDYADLKQREWSIFGKETIRKRNSFVENIYAIRSLDDDKIELLIAEEGIISTLELIIESINKELK